MKHKSGLIGFSYLAGLICALFIKTTAAFIIAAILLCISVVLSLSKKKNISLVLFTVSAAMAVCSIYTVICYDPLIKLSGETREIQGTVTDFRLYSEDKAAYTVKTNIDGTEANITFFYTDHGCKTGDTVSFTAKLSKLTNNTNFAEESYYRSKGIFLKAQSVNNFTIIKKQSFNIKTLLTEFSDYIADKIQLSLTDEEGALLKAMFLGDKSDLPNSLSNNIKRCGISHFTAVSGLHLTIISHIIMLILSLTPINKNRKVKFGFLIALILMFMLFFKLSMSVIRAGIMLIIYYGSEVFMRKGSAVSSMGIAILIITLFQPYACVDIGFLLSLAGTFGVAVISPYFCEKVRKTALYGIKSAVLSIFCATLTTFPLSCFFFGGFSAVGILVNLLIYPFFFIALICMVLFTITLGFGTGFLFIAGIISRIMIFIINLIGSFKYSYIAVTDDTILVLCILSTVFIALIYFVFRSKRETVIAVILSCAVLIGSSTILYMNGKGKTKLILYSDGDYPCVILENERENIICAGSDSPDIMEYIESYMENRFLDKTDTVIILNQNHNYLEKFKEIPCNILILPNENKNTENSDEDISFTKNGSSVIIEINGISLSVSAAKEPIDADISIIYGYKKDFPTLKGKVMFSDNQMYGEKYDGINFYYEQSEFYITDKGYLEQLKG